MTKSDDTCLGGGMQSGCIATNDDTDLYASIEAQLPNLPWEQRFEQMPGWAFDLVANRPICPAAVVMRLNSARSTGSGGIELRFRASQSDCRDCPKRSACTTSKSLVFAKHISFVCAAPASTAETLSERKDTKKHKSPASRPSDGHPRRPKCASKLVQPSAAEIGEPGPFEMRKPFLVALTLMWAFMTAARNALIHVHVEVAPISPPPPDYYAMTDAKRQHRRKTWNERHAWNGLPPGSAVKVRIILPKGAGLLCEGYDPFPGQTVRLRTKTQGVTSHRDRDVDHTLCKSEVCAL